MKQSKQADEVRVEYRPLAELARWPRNPKGHDIPAIQASIRRHGFINPLVEDERTSQLVAGHGRLESLLTMQQAGEEPPARIKVGPDGGWLVPVLTGVSFASEQEAENFLLADNRLVELGGWDQAGLTSMLEDLQHADAIEGTGWSDQEVTAMLLVGTPRPTPAPQDVEFRAYDENDANKIKMAECPSCKHKFPL